MATYADEQRNKKTKQLSIFGSKSSFGEKSNRGKYGTPSLKISNASSRGISVVPKKGLTSYPKQMPVSPISGRETERQKPGGGNIFDPGLKRAKTKSLTNPNRGKVSTLSAPTTANTAKPIKAKPSTTPKSNSAVSKPKTSVKKPNNNKRDRGNYMMRMIQELDKLTNKTNYAASQLQPVPSKALSNINSRLANRNRD